MKAVILAVFALLTTVALGQTPELQVTRRHGGGELYLMIGPQATNWVTLESSRDLATWFPSFHVLTTNSSTLGSLKRTPRSSSTVFAVPGYPQPMGLRAGIP